LGYWAIGSCGDGVAVPGWSSMLWNTHSRKSPNSPIAQSPNCPML